MFNLLTIRNFLDAGTCRQIVGEMRTAAGQPASVYGTNEGGAIRVGIRSTTSVRVSEETRELVRGLILERKDALEEHFSRSVNECEQPQFLRYRAGDYFVPHQDGNTPLIRDDTRWRKLSVIVFLNSGDDLFEGGSLELHGVYPDLDARLRIKNELGSLVAFPAETTHEVTPVTAGERFTIVSWLR
jgi:SM-20-related protein